MTSASGASSRPIRVLIVDDSIVCRSVLRSALETDPEIEVVGEAGDGLEAISLVEVLKPSLVTLDLQMPRMGGLETIDWIMKNRPTPILVVTDRPRLQGADMTFASLSRGALDLVAKASTLKPGSSQERAFVTRVKALSRAAAKPTPACAAAPSGRSRSPLWAPRLVAIGASTGGPNALGKVLGHLAKEFPLPIVIVQHMDPLFQDSFVFWLKQQSMLPVQMAADGHRLSAGEVLIAPAGTHLEVQRNGRVRLASARAFESHVPSVDQLFRSVSDAFGANSIGVLLTGMGSDGADGLRELRRRGALTIAQDQETSVIYGMPGAAVELNAVDHVLPISRIAPFLVNCEAQTRGARQAINSPSGLESSSGGAAGDGAANMKQKILIVDDSPVILEAGKNALEDAGYDVVTLDNPLVVASVIRREKPDLVLLDVIMPVIAGDVVAQIVHQKMNAGTPVVFYSDLTAPELEQLVTKSGAAGFIQKTADEPAFVSRVKDFLANR